MANFDARMTLFDSERGRQLAIDRHRGQRGKQQSNKLQDADMRKIRALQMMQMRILGHTKEEVAAHFNVSLDTVHRDMELLRDQGLLQEAEEALIEGLHALVQPALEAYKEVLNRPGPSKLKSEAAKDVLKHLDRRAERAERKKEAQTQRKFDLMAHLAKKYGITPDGLPSVVPSNITVEDGAEVIDVEESGSPNEAADFITPAVDTPPGNE